MSARRAARDPVLKGFPPIIDRSVEILILGSFPSVASLARRQYYGHPQNQFWRLLGAVIGEPLQDMQYERRKRTLLEHRIGVWDVIDRCRRNGSLDGDIRDPRHNAFARVLARAPRLRRVCFNGKTSGRQEPLFRDRYETLLLPSSSPAYTLSFDEKLEQWRRIVSPRRSVRRAGASGAALPPRASRSTLHASRHQC